MNREIKFNAFIKGIGIIKDVTIYGDGETKLIGICHDSLQEQLPENYRIEDEAVEDEKGNKLCDAMLGEDWVYFENAIRVQYTGLKDKNGVEIYEGDILSVKGNADNTKKEFLNQKYVMEWNNTYCRFWAKPLNKSHHSELHLPFTQQDSEAIGNIYEHPQLLTTNK